MQEVVQRLSNERLEDQIAQIFQEAHRVNPEVKLKETGVLKVLWEEFDRRVSEGIITVE